MISASIEIRNVVAVPLREPDAAERSRAYEWLKRNDAAPWVLAMAWERYLDAALREHVERAWNLKQERPDASQKRVDGDWEIMSGGGEGELPVQDAYVHISPFGTYNVPAEFYESL